MNRRVMQGQGRRTGGWRGFSAVCLLAIGALLVSTSAASASSLVGANAVITFWNNLDVVTVNTPAMCPTTPSNPTGAPTCQWMLFVNEPDVPAQNTVGTAVGGLSAILTVPYPANFCGVLQADVEVGPPPWRLLYGRQIAIQTGNCDCATPQSTSVVAPTNSSVTGQAVATAFNSSASQGQTRKDHRRTTSVHPRRAGFLHRPQRPSRRRLTNWTSPQGKGTGTTTQTIGQPPACVTIPFTGSAWIVPASTQAPVATLPFTGLDVRPVAMAGTVLILLGLGVLTTGEQKRSAVRLAGRSTARYSTRAARWLLGD